MDWTDTDRINDLMDVLQLKNRAAFDVWAEDGFPLFEGSVDSHDLQWDREDERYRVKTEEDRETKRAAAAERRRRYEAGEMPPWEALSYKVMLAYIRTSLYHPPLLPFMLSEEE